jgi:SAM-dependent methyltransferase
LSLEQITSSLRLSDDGIWYAADAEAISYPAEGNEKCFSIEEQSFWFAHRNACINALIETWLPADGGAIFDIGGGNGYVAKAILEAGRDVVLVEPGISGARNARNRGVPVVVCASLETARFAPGSLSAASLFDVLEHIEDDEAFLQALCRLLKPGGRVYLTVPAYNALWSHHDDAAGHFRRYTRAGLAQVLESSGFSVDYASYFFRPLPIPVFLLRSLPQKLGIGKPETVADGGLDDHKVSSTFVRRLLAAALRPEIDTIRRRQTMRFGGSCLVAASAH